MTPLAALTLKVLIAGLLASLACGLGAIPILIPRLNIQRHTGIGYSFAGGLMFSASVYNLILPALKIRQHASLDLQGVLPVIVGIVLGAMFLATTDWVLHRSPEKLERWKGWGGHTGTLIFIAMSIHSVPEGVAVGVGYAGESRVEELSSLGSYIALAIAIHNIPEGLAVAIPLRSAGASFGRCFLAAFLTSLPQPAAAVPALWLSWFFEPLLPILMGFAAGAMIFLVVLELIPDALEDETPMRTAWAFTGGFCLMLLVQVVL